MTTERKAMVIRLTPYAHLKLQLLAEKWGVSMNKAIDRLVQERLVPNSTEQIKEEKERKEANNAGF